jgi:hypothetical protein
MHFGTTSMTLRKPLRRRIQSGWETCIKDDVDSFRVNSERSLQAALWFRLTEEFLADDSRKRQILIEPHISIGKDHYFPDLVICNSRRIIGVIELKYQPKREPSVDKDLSTLSALWTCQDKDVGVTLRRHRGPNAKVKTFHISDDLLIVWAGVHSAISSERTNGILPTNKECYPYFMRLHAATSDDDIAKVSSCEHPFSGVA